MASRHTIAIDLAVSSLQTDPDLPELSPLLVLHLDTMGPHKQGRRRPISELTGTV